MVICYWHDHYFMTVFLKTMGILQMLRVPFFAIGLSIELVAIIIFLKKRA
jgi:hypothetical protein